MCLSALRGDAQAVRTALQQLGPEPIDRLAAGQRTQGYQRLIASLLKTKQFPLALEIAKTAPEFRPGTRPFCWSTPRAPRTVGSTRRVRR